MAAISEFPRDRFEFPYVIEILRAPGVALHRDQVAEARDIHREPADLCPQAAPPRWLEREGIGNEQIHLGSGQLRAPEREYGEPLRSLPVRALLAVSEGPQRNGRSRPVADAFQRRERRLDVRLVEGERQIEVGREARMAVQNHGDTSDHQISRTRRFEYAEDPLEIARHVRKVSCAAAGGDMKDLRGKVAVITGGASGIGFASAEALAREGAKLVLADIEPKALATAAAQLRAAGADAIGVVTDVTDRKAVEALADATWKHYGRADIVFNNAGVAVAGPVAGMTHEDWRWVIDVDLWGVIHGVEAFVPRLVEQGEGGHVLATASFAGLVPNVGLGAYCVAKYGVVALMEVLHRELRANEIGASVLCPMRVRTAIDDSGRNRQADYGGPEAQHYPKVEDGQMAGRVIGVAEVAALVVDGIRRNKLYLLPHEESRQMIRRRFERIDRAFEG